MHPYDSIEPPVVMLKDKLFLKWDRLTISGINSDILAISKLIALHHYRYHFNNN